MGHKWMWNEALGGLPPEEFFVSVNPVLEGIRAAIALGKYRKAGVPAGTLSGEWAQRLGISAGIPVGMGRSGCALGRRSCGNQAGRCRKRDRHIDLHYRNE